MQLQDFELLAFSFHQYSQYYVNARTKPSTFYTFCTAFTLASLSLYLLDPCGSFPCGVFFKSCGMMTGLTTTEHRPSHIPGESVKGGGFNSVPPEPAASQHHHLHFRYFCFIPCFLLPCFIWKRPCPLVFFQLCPFIPGTNAEGSKVENQC